MSLCRACVSLSAAAVAVQVAIVLIGSVLEQEKKSCTAMYETLQLLKNPPKKYLQEKPLLARVIRLELTAADLQREHAIQSNARRIKRFAEEKRKKQIESRRQDPLSRSVRESKAEKTLADNGQRRVNGRYVSLPVNGSSGYESYSKEPSSGSRSHRRSSSEARPNGMRGEWLESEVRNRRDKRIAGRGNSR